MDDFTDFESVPSAATQPNGNFNADDAMNDFLAREAAMKQQLGETDDLFGSAPAAMPMDPMSQPMDDFSTPVSAAAVVPVSAAPVAATEGGYKIFSTKSQTQLSASSYAKLPETESEPIRKWKEEQALKIAEKDKLSAAKHEETVQRARKEIDQFYDEYNQKKAKQIARNRELEKTYNKSREEEGKTVPNVWDRVVNQVDLNAVPSKAKVEAKSSTGSGSGSGNNAAKPAAEVAAKKDTSRMKNLLLQLKNDPKAPGNAAVSAH